MSEDDARFGIINISSFMKSLLLSCLLIAGLSSACSPGVSNSAVSARYAERDSLLTALDRTVANKAVYIGLRHGRIDSLEAEFARESDPERKLKIGQAIFRLYFDFQNDLALEHLEEMQTLAAEIADTRPDYLQIIRLNRVSLLRFMGHLKESSEQLDEVAHFPVSPEVYPSYLMEQMRNYAFLCSNSHSGSKEYYDRMAEAYRDSLLMFSEQGQYVVILAERLVERNQLDMALAVLHDVYDKLDPCSKRAGTLAYNIALCHNAMTGDDEKAEYERYLILSAISDLRNGVRGYKSLPRLAIRMYELGDIDRAYNYMKCSMEDVINSSARIRTQEVSEMFVMINESYQLQALKQQRRVAYLLIVIGSVCVLLFVLLLFISYQNVQLASVKQKLSDANLTKEGYMGVFIESYSNHLARMNSFRLKSVKILKAGNLSEIEQFVDRALNMTDDQEELHRKFDVAILSIFPTFIEEYNRLMKVPEHNSGRGKLTIEQRIAAFIRLGVTESDKIALFLRYSIRTVYNYRSQMRNKAKNPRDLEKEIAQIGLMRIPAFSSPFRRMLELFKRVFRKNGLT